MKLQKLSEVILRCVNSQPILDIVIIIPKLHLQSQYQNYTCTWFATCKYGVNFFLSVVCFYSFWLSLEVPFCQIELIWSCVQLHDCLWVPVTNIILMIMHQFKNACCRLDWYTEAPYYVSHYDPISGITRLKSVQLWYASSGVIDNGHVQTNNLLWCHFICILQYPLLFLQTSTRDPR